MLFRRIYLILLIFLTLANRVNASTDTGNGQVFIPASKNLGLGTLNPNSKVTINGNLSVRETSRPGINSTFGKLYVNGNTSNLMFLDDSGVQYDLLSAAGGGSGFDGSTFDGLDSTQFLRSDTSDQFTSGTLTTNIGTTLRVNGDIAIADTNIALTGASTTFTGTGFVTLSPGAGSNLNVNMSGAGDLAVNTNQFYVDTSTSNIGIGTTSPSSKLVVRGTTTVNGFTMTSGAVNNYVLTSNVSGTGSWTNPSGITAGNANTIDGLDSLQFLRSDTSDQFTSGTLTTATGTILRVNGDSYFNNPIRLAPNNNIVLVKGSTINGAAAEDGFRIRMKPAYINSSRDAVMFEKLETNTNFPGGFAFSTTDRNGTQANAFTISGSGDYTRVGINSNNPQFTLQALGYNTPSIALGAIDPAENGWRQFMTQGLQANGSLINKWAVGSFSDNSSTGGNMFYIYQYSNNGDQFLHPTNPYEGVQRLLINDNGQFAFGYNSYASAPTNFDFAFNGTGMFDRALALKEASRPLNTINYGRLYVNGATSNLMFLDDSGTQYDLLSAASGGGGSDADTLDMLDSAQFLRSDTSDVFTSGTLTTKNGTTFRVNGDLAILDNDISFNSATGVTFTPTAGQNLNIALSGAGDFAVNTNQLYVDTSTSNVGIGLTNPSARLAVNGDFAMKEMAASTAASGFGKLYVSSTDSELYFDADDQSAVRLTNNGLLSIGNLSINDLTDAVSDGFSTVYLGANSGSRADSGASGSTGVGINALRDSDDNSAQNVAIGFDAMRFNNNGDSNIAIGYRALYNTTNSSMNVAVGEMSLYSNTTGGQNTSVGVRSLQNNKIGSFNVAYGHESMFNNENGSFNSAMGYRSMFNNKNGDYNSAFGYEALRNNREGDENIAVGWEALYSTTNGNYNTAVGTKALNNNSGNSNTAIGAYSLRYTKRNANDNTAVGFESLSHIYNGSRNTALGIRAGVGNGNGLSGTTFDNGVFMGYEAGYRSNGDNNIFIGYKTGRTTNVRNNILIGSEITSSANDQLNIGNSIFGNLVSRNIGIGINNTTSKLTINGDTALRERNRPALAANYGKLYVNGSTSNLMFLDDSGIQYDLLASSGGGGANAGTLDGLDSLQFLRSDSSDQFTSGTLTTNIGTTLRVNGDLAIADTNISLTGASTTFTQTTGAISFVPAAGQGLNINLSSTGDFAVNTNQLYLDTSTTNIGLGTVSPNEKLTIEGRSSLRETTRPTANANYGKIYVNGTTSNLMFLDDSGIQFDLLQVAAGGGGNADTIDLLDSTQFLRSDASDQFTGNTLTIGAASTLRVNGNLEIADTIIPFTGANATFVTSGPVSFTPASGNNFIIATSGAGDFIVNTNQLFVNGQTTNVGIGLTNPNEKLTVSGRLSLQETTAPSSTANFGKLYVNSTTSNLFFMDDAGIAYDITTAISSSSSSIDSLTDAISDGADTVFLGNGSGLSNTSGNFNVGLGIRALSRNTSGSFNTAVGFESMNGNTIGYSNSAYGFRSLYSNINGYSNTAIGMNSLRRNTRGYFNTAIGNGSLERSNGANLNTAIGASSMFNSLTSSSNVAVGANSLGQNISGQFNTALGNNALKSASGSSSNNVAIGYNAGNGTSLTTYSNNVFVGFESGRNTSTGSNNTLLGANTGNITSGNFNILIGSGVQAPSATASNQLNIGNTIYGDLANRNIGIGINNTSSKLTVNGAIAIREGSRPNANPVNMGRLYVNGATSNLMFLDDSGVQYDITTIPPAAGAIGIDDLVDGKSDSSRYLLIGTGAVNANPGSNYATGVGIDALKNCGSNCSNNTALGYKALELNSNGDNNTAMGHQALANNTSGINNIAIGYQSMLNNTSGGGNTAAGSQSLLNNTTGGGNVAFGAEAMRSNSFGANNTAIGSNSLKNFAPIGGSTANTAIGASSLLNNLSGISNTAIGVNSLNGNTSGQGNIGVGNKAGLNNLTGGNNIFIGNNSGAQIVTGSTNIAIGHNASFPGDGDNQLVIGSAIYGKQIDDGLNAKIGIGVTNPQRALHISSVMRLEPTASPPPSPAEGDIYIDSTGTKAYCIYLNGTWQKIIGSGVCI
ncbi:MAG: hypothetical protein LW817_02680 [Candidatus Caenarcaniphilales bacterium]|jgi:hypothetical protein|nr:hypothetical protein [Candidatus Caenarcaniphilales bacterium]